MSLIKTPLIYPADISTALNNITNRIRYWITTAFGPVLERPFDPRERGLRFLEEAIEFAQALGVTSQEVAALKQRVFDRPADGASKEFAQCFITLLAASGSIDTHPTSAINDEWQRIQDLGPEHFGERMRRKIELGLAVEKIAKDRVPSQPLPSAYPGVCTYVFAPAPTDEDARAADVWADAKDGVARLNEAITYLKSVGYEVELHISSTSDPNVHRLYGAQPEPGGVIYVLHDPHTVTLKGAVKTIRKEL